MEHENDRRTGAASAGMQSGHWAFMVERELRGKEKLYCQSTVSDGQ